MRQGINLQLIHRVKLLLLLSAVLVCCARQPAANISTPQTTVSVQATPLSSMPLSSTPLSTTTSATIVFPTQHPLPDPQSYPASLTTGKLLLVDGCVRIGTTQSSYLIIWATGFTYTFENNQLVVVDKSGVRRAKEGDTIQLGGGEISLDAEAWRTAPALQQPQPSCSSPYWFASPDIEVVR